MANIDFANASQTPDNTLPISGNELVFGAAGRGQVPIVYKFPFTTSGTINPVVSMYGTIVGRNNFTVTDGSVTNISVVADLVGIGTATPDSVLTVNKNGTYSNKLAAFSNTSNTNPNAGVVDITHGSGGLTVNAAMSVFNNAYVDIGAYKKNSLNINSTGGNGLSISASNADGSISLYAGGTGATKEALKVFPSGNIAVGFGTAGYSDNGQALAVNGVVSIIAPALIANDSSAVTAAWVKSQSYATGGAVSSVNAKTGAVVLSAGDVDAYTKGTTDATFATVAWVNSQLTNNGIGDGQVWVNVTSSRAGGNIHHTNTTGRPIMVTLVHTNYTSNNLFYFVGTNIAEDNVVQWSGAGADTGITDAVSFIVPNGSFYYFNAATKVLELTQIVDINPGGVSAIGIDSTDGVYDADAGSGFAIATPSVTPSGGTGGYTYTWSFTSNPQGASLLNGTSQTPTVRKAYTNQSNGMFNAILKCVVKDSALNQFTVTGIIATAEWYGSNYK